ncbi:hypothetical protein F751_3270 [Auxenochlorella protothecoides]|uniref:Patatin n=1 Tax=Auxenochlorella protothecoides TaxID=3075 RepID=A0A087STY5_AUXPR|nr:hypothetical protein F751_3270 [Auxenochlorella protothecoides]KFM29189.1 hypothetical protein F751_3270 [Auxenochlorella protothecoides]
MQQACPQCILERSVWFKGSPCAPKPRRRSARPSLRCQRVSYPQAVSSAPVEVGTVPEKADKGFWRRKRAQVPKSTDEVQHDAEARQLQAEPVKASKLPSQFPGSHLVARLRGQAPLTDPVAADTLEGGGMRGCVSGGALQALNELGLAPLFDVVYGSSAGAINATYFLSGQRDGVTIYHDHIAHEGFVSLKRLWRGQAAAPVLNLPYLIDHVMEGVLPLDWDAVLASRLPLKVVASSLDSLKPIVLDGFDSKEDLKTCLKASANIPEIAGGPITHRGHRLVDAAVFEAIPFRSAIADGCTHALVLCTRPRPRPRTGPMDGALEGALEAAVKRAVLSPDYMVPAWKAEYAAILADGCTADEQLAGALDGDDAAGGPPAGRPWFAGAHVYPVYPGPAAAFSPLCTDADTLRAGVAEGRAAVLRTLAPLLGDALGLCGEGDDAAALLANNIAAGGVRGLDALATL